MSTKYIVIQSLARASAILDHIADAGKNTGIKAIAEHIGLHKSTCFGLLQALQHLGYVAHDKETGRYSLGIKVFQLGQAYTSCLDIRKLAQPQMTALAQQSRETVHLVIREGLHVVYIDKIEALHAMTPSSRVGQRASLHCTSVGKAILAHMTEAEQERALEGVLTRYTEHTITDKDALLEHLQTIRHEGICFNDQETEIGLCAFAAPIFDAKGDAVAAIGVSGSVTRLNRKYIQELLPCLQHAVAEVSRQLGYNMSTAG